MFIWLSPMTAKCFNIPVQNTVLRFTSGIALSVPKMHYFEHVF